MPKKIVNVKRHQRKVPSGGKTTVRRHTRRIEGYPGVKLKRKQIEEFVEKTPEELYVSEFVSGTNIKEALKEMNMDYYCSKCSGKKHRYGTKIWEQHLDHFSPTGLSKDIIARAKMIQNEKIKKEKFYQMTWKKQDQNMMQEKFDNVIPGLQNGHYFYLEINPQYGNQPAELRILGKRDGYDTLEELYNTDLYGAGDYIRQAERGEHIGIIMKATPYKIIKKF